MRPLNIPPAQPYRPPTIWPTTQPRLPRSPSHMSSTYVPYLFSRQVDFRRRMATDTPLTAYSSLQDPTDPVSYVCAWLALAPQALCVVYVTLIWSSREAEVALLFAGQLACEAINFALKRLIKEERPRRIHGKGYGMPSSHAQFLAFWALSLALFLLVRHRPKAHKVKKQGAGGGGGSDKKETVKATAAPAWDLWQLQELYGVDRYPHRPWSMFERAAVSAMGFALAGVVAWSRVYLGYHTPKQVFVGLSAGCVSAIGWFVATEVARQTGLLGWVLSLPAARWFRLRDLVIEEDICQAGWEKWEQRRVALAVAAGKSDTADTSATVNDKKNS